MPVEAAKSPTSNPVPLADANAQNTPKKKQAVGKAALAKVTLLDGSVLDVTIDVSAFGRLSFFSFLLVVSRLARCAPFKWSNFIVPFLSSENCSERQKEKI